MAKQKQLLSSDQAKPAKRQHKSPCSDCPWARKSLRGWLGGTPAEDWIRDAHGEALVKCHTKVKTRGGAHQCAGLAIYRANVCKSPRSPEIIRLPANRELCFSSPMEFLGHHGTKSNSALLESEDEDEG